MLISVSQAVQSASTVLAIVLAGPAFYLSVVDFSTARKALELRASQTLVETYYRHRDALFDAATEENSLPAVIKQKGEDYGAIVRHICRQREERLLGSTSEAFLMEVIKTDVTNAIKVSMLESEAVPESCFEK